MDRNKADEDRPNRRYTQKRVCLASFLNTNLLKLGAGVSLSVATCGISTQIVSAQETPGTTSEQQLHERGSVVRNNPFVPPTTAPTGLFADSVSQANVRQTSDMQFSELRLKSIGTAVGLVPIGNPRSAAATIEVSHPRPSKIRVNPMAGDSSEALEQPVTNLAVAAEADSTATSSQGNHPNVLALRRCDPLQKIAESVTETDQTSESGEAAPLPNPHVEVAQTLVFDGDEIASKEEQPSVTPEMTAADSSASDSRPQEGYSFSFSDIPSAPNNATVAATATDADGAIPRPPTDHSGSIANAPAKQPGLLDAREELPLLPVPVRKWVEAAPAPATVAKYPQRRRQHVEVAAPPMISAAQREPARAVTAAPIVPARLAGYTPQKVNKPEQPPTVPTNLDPLQVLMREIRDSHPTARISLAEVKNRVVVRGVCRSREQATEVLRMIRSQFLVPVDDQLVIR